MDRATVCNASSNRSTWRAAGPDSASVSIVAFGTQILYYQPPPTRLPLPRRRRFSPWPSRSIREWRPVARPSRVNRIRHDKMDTSGSVTLRYKGKLHHIGVGCPDAGWRVILLVAGLDVRVLGIDGWPLRHLTLDPSVDYQRIP
jgi:hypothetical protein